MILTSWCAFQCSCAGNAITLLWFWSHLKTRFYKKSNTKLLKQFKVRTSPVELTILEAKRANKNRSEDKWDVWECNNITQLSRIFPYWYIVSEFFITHHEELFIHFTWTFLPLLRNLTSCFSFHNWMTLHFNCMVDGNSVVFGFILFWAKGGLEGTVC